MISNQNIFFFQDKIDIDFQSEYLRDDDDDDVFNSDGEGNENDAMFQQLNRDIDIFNRDLSDVTYGVGTLGNSGGIIFKNNLNDDCFFLF